MKYSKVLTSSEPPRCRTKRTRSNPRPARAVHFLLFATSLPPQLSIPHPIRFLYQLRLGSSSDLNLLRPTPSNPSYLPAAVSPSTGPSSAREILHRLLKIKVDYRYVICLMKLWRSAWISTYSPTGPSRATENPLTSPTCPVS